MPQFTYTPYVNNPATNSISELMLRRGDIAARQAEQVGAIQAHAAQQSGQAMAGAIGNIGQIAAAVPGQMQQQRMNALGEANMRGQIADRTSLAAERNVKTQALQREQQGLDVLAETIKASVNPETGEIDHVAVARNVTQAGFPDLAQHYTDGIEKTATSRLAFLESTRKAGAAKTHYLGELALSGVAAIDRDPTNPMAARDAVMGHVAAAAATGAISEGEARDFLMKTAGANPQQLKDVLQYFVEQAPELVKSETARKKADADTAHVKAETAKIDAEIAGTLPKPKSLQSKSVMVDGKPVEVTFDPATGKLFLNGVDVTAKATPIPPASMRVDLSTHSNAVEMVHGMADGSLPPLLPGRATKEYAEVMAEAHRQGFDLAGANLDWTATTKHLSTMNGAQQLRMNQAINALPDMLDKADSLMSQWKGGRFPILNKANLAAAKAGAYGPDVASVATQLDAQIADITADLGNVYMGGNSPTDQALGLAAKSLKGEWSAKVFHDMIALARNNVSIRQNSIRNTGVAGASPNNPYSTQTPAAPVAEEWVRDANGKLVKKGG